MKRLILSGASLPSGGSPISWGLLFLLGSKVLELPQWANYLLVGLFSIILMLWAVLWLADYNAEKLKLSELVERLEKIERRTGLRP